MHQTAENAVTLGPYDAVVHNAGVGGARKLTTRMEAESSALIGISAASARYSPRLSPMTTFPAADHRAEVTGELSDERHERHERHERVKQKLRRRWSSRTTSR